MLQKLQKKWGVGGWRLFLILVSFAVGGSLTGYLGRMIMNYIDVSQPVWWSILYIIIVCLLWPPAVLLVSIFFGQFRFFKNYVSKVFSRLIPGQGKSGKIPEPVRSPEPMLSPAFAMQNDSATDKVILSNRFSASVQSQSGARVAVRVAIFASGAGSNAQNIITHFRNHPSVSISLVVCNKPGAGVIQIAEKERIPILIIEKEKFFRGNAYLDELKAAGINFIVLAGFLWKLPSSLIQAFPKRIVNIHPALLPKFGGKGMFGQHVHEAVIGEKETRSGITIHYVDEILDHGETIFQASCLLDPGETPESLAAKIHKLEYEYYPKVIESILSGHSQSLPSP